MPGPADLLYLLSGQPDPSRQLAALLSGQQQPQGSQGAPPQSAAPPGATSSPAPSGGAAAGAGPNPSPGDPAPPGSQPQPQALQSTPDMSASYQQLANPPNLMSLYLQLQQRQSASDQINKGFALIAANHAGNPGMARAIMDSAGGQGDAGGMVNNLMSLYQTQQGMAAQQQLLAQAPGIAQKLGMDEGVVRAEIMAGRGPDLVRSLEPTDAMRNYQQARGMLKQAGVPDDQIDTFTRPMLLGAGSNPAMAEYIQRVAEAQHTGTMAQHPELSGGFYSWQKAQEAKQADTLAKQGKINEAQASFGAVDNVLTIMENQADTLQKASADGKLDKLFKYPQGWVKAASAGDAWSWFANKGINLSEEEKGYVKDIMDLTSTDMRSLGSTSSRHIAPQLGTIGARLGPLSDLSRGQKGWNEKLGDLVNQIDIAKADNYGGSGQTPPDQYKKFMNPIYGAGGSMNLRPAQPMPSQEIADSIEAVKSGSKTIPEVLSFARAGNYDTKELERQLAQLKQ